MIPDRSSGGTPVCLRLISLFKRSNQNGVPSESATVVISDFVTGDTLSANLPTTGGIVNGTNIAVSYDVNGTLTLSGSDTKDHYQTVLDAVQYSTSNANPTNSGTDNPRTITCTVTCSPLKGDSDGEGAVLLMEEVYRD